MTAASLPSSRALRAASLLLVAAMLAACGRGGDDATPAPPAEAGSDAPAEAAGTLAALPPGFDGSWQGVLPCVDCAGIEVDLRLRESGDATRFDLVERYLGGESGAEYRSEGRWNERDCEIDGEPGRCLQLEDAGQRWFRRADGSLQAIDGEGRPLDPDGARLQRV